MLNVPPAVSTALISPEPALFIIINTYKFPYFENNKIYYKKDNHLRIFF